MAYRYILGQPAAPRFLWEAEVFLTNLLSLDPDADVIMIFDTQNTTAVARLRDKYGIEIHEYPDLRDDKSYAASTRPYLFWKYFSEDPEREKGQYIQVETDIIFRELPKLPVLRGKEIIGGDCEGYVGYEYNASRILGKEIIDGFSRILNMTKAQIADVPGIGAQFAFSNPTADLWWHIYMDSNLLWHFINSPRLATSNIQRWSVEMLAQLYNFAKYGWDVAIDHELDHCTPTDNIEMWEHRKILHNAGVIGEGAAGLFYKGKYINRSPFTDDLSWVRKDRCSYEYVKAIKAVVL